MEVIKLENKHLDEFISFRIKSHKESEYINSSNINKATKLLKEYNKDNGKFAFIVLDNNTVIGQLYVKINPISNICHLLSISILKEYYGTGLSYQLLNKVKELAKINNKDIIELIVNKNNERALNFYKNNGFKFIKHYNTNDDIYQINLKEPGYKTW